MLLHSDSLKRMLRQSLWLNKSFEPAHHFRVPSVLGLGLSAFFLIFWQFSLNAGNWYVRSSASGSNNGTDWNNAWTNVTAISWSSLSPGDSVWLAGGSYGTIMVGKGGTTNAPIYIARVRTTNSIPASAAGWNSSYDSAVWINRVDASYGSGWWTLDGQVPLSGISVTNDSTGPNHCVYFGSAPCNYITIKNCTLAGSAADLANPNIKDVRCIHANFSATPTAIGWYLGYCLIKNNATLLITLGVSQMTIEHCIFTGNYPGTSGIHENVWAVTGATNITFRFNEVSNWLTEGIMMDFVSAADAPNDGWDIYGNLWHDSVGGSYGRILESQYRAQYRIRLYNNTFVNLYGGLMTANGGTWGTGCSAKNNISFNCSTGNPVGFGVGDDDYGLSDVPNAQTHGIGSATSAIFLNYAGSNYVSTGTVGTGYPTDKGIALGLPYNFDFLGINRPQGAAWDIGAYEYNGGVAPPTGLKLQSQATP